MADVKKMEALAVYEDVRRKARKVFLAETKLERVELYRAERAYEAAKAAHRKAVAPAKARFVATWKPHWDTFAKLRDRSAVSV